MKKTTANKTQRKSIDVNSVSKRRKLGQVFTPAPTARFMASLLSSATSNCHLLDAGAGLGALSGAFLEECLSKKLKFDAIQLKSFDLDDELHHHLHRLLDGYTDRVPLTFDITGGDFIGWAVNRIQAERCDFTHAILNPPYQKIGSKSPTCQLLRQVGIESGNIKWPNPGAKRANSIKHNCVTEKALYPKGWYCVVRRISSREEKRRIVASVVDPDIFDGSSMLGFENHLNVFHDNRQGMPEELARSLAVFLNSTVADNQFRQFSGHTQVNATDLKQLRYPNRGNLIKLGSVSEYPNSKYC